MAASLRGQLGVKSSALAPTSSKLTSQMLVISHMDNHYRKINKAKPAIDNATPKSMLSSQKMRDREVKKHIEKYGSRPSSRSTYRPDSANGMYDESQWEEPQDDEERQVQDIMRTTLRVPLKAQHMDSIDGTAGSKSESPGFGTTTMRPHSASMRGMVQAMRGVSQFNRTRPMSARSNTSLASNFSQTSRSTNALKVTYDGDVLSKHAQSFTEPSKPFTPRTLKSNRESSLKRYKYYTPPSKKTLSFSNSSDMVSREETKVKEVVVPQAKPRQRSKRKEDLGATETLTETMLMDMSLQSHHPRQQGDSSGVPRLDISMDKDHFNWMKEQATRAQIRARNGTSTHAEDSGVPDGGDTLERTSTLGNTDTLRFTRTASSAKSYGIKSPTSHRLGQAEEEQKYVTFAHEVTQDIVTRGISSDRVLQKVFENHIERKKGELDERRLRAIITDIRRDLGIQHVEPEERKGVQYSNDLEQTMTMEDEVTGTMASGNTTMSATNNTYNFDRTTDVLSTIRSQPEEEDLSGTATLLQYQMNLTVQDKREEDQNSVESDGMGQTMTTGKLGSTMVNGEVESGSVDGSEDAGESTVADAPRPAARTRHLTRQDASTAGQENISRQASATDTDAKTENDEEEEEEEYEDDYDADEDDNQDKMSDDDF